jgi:two-component system CheB/CheR fusion protein
MDPFGQRLFILIAEDNRDLARSLAMLLNLVGFDVETVHDGRDALSAARARRPDAIILDIGLPGMDGFQVAEQMRSDPSLENILIIATSGYGPDMFQDRSQRAGFDHHLAKPVAFQTILSLLARLH